MSKKIDFDSVKFASWECQKGVWVLISTMLNALTEEEIEKIPSILDKPTIKEVAEKYGICDSIQTENGWVEIYSISGSIFKGETKF